MTISCGSITLDAKALSDRMADNVGVCGKVTQMDLRTAGEKSLQLVIQFQENETREIAAYQIASDLGVTAVCVMLTASLGRDVYIETPTKPTPGVEKLITYVAFATAKQ